MAKIKEISRIIFEKADGGINVKEKWSVKKKLLLVGGVVAGLAAGIFTYGKIHENDCDNEESSEGDFEFEFEETGEDLEENLENIESDIEVGTQE